jgi:hypothetical protein
VEEEGERHHCAVQLCVCVVSVRERKADALFGFK